MVFTGKACVRISYNPSRSAAQEIDTAKPDHDHTAIGRMDDRYHFNSLKRSQVNVGRAPSLKEQIMDQIRKITARHVLFTLIILAVLSATPSHAQNAMASKEYTKLLAKADRLLGEEKFPSATRAYRRANKAAGGTSTEALMGLAIAAYKAEQYADSQTAARQLLDLPGNQEIQMAAYNLLGLSILQSRTTDRASLTEAEQAFRHVLKSHRNVPAIRLSLATVLLELDRTAESLILARELLAEETSETESDRARILVCRLRRTLRSEAANYVSGTVEEPVTDGTIEEPVTDGTIEEPVTDGTVEESVIGATVEESVGGTVEVSVGGTVVAPVPIFGPQPKYPESLLRHQVRGHVVVQVIIDKEGCVTNIKTLDSPLIELEMAAVRALKTWTFRPATLNGRGVDVYYNMTVNFGFR